MPIIDYIEVFYAAYFYLGILVIPSAFINQPPSSIGFVSTCY